MKSVLVGLGVQGNKRLKVAKKDIVAKVDPFQKNYFNSLYDVPLEIYDTVILCVPDNLKLELINFSIENKKNVMLEKPFIVQDINFFTKLQKKANKNQVYIYTCYNHRFEPHLIKLQKLLFNNKYGKVYNCRIFYGNGTAALVKNSPWRDKKTKGVIEDLGSHIIDIIFFLFDKKINRPRLINSFNYENKSPDYSIFNVHLNNNILIQCEASLCSWKNTFTCDIFCEKGSMHIENLCKWGPSIFTERKRTYPSGKPIEIISTIKQSDPTWKAEYKYFKNKVNKKEKTSLEKDKFIQSVFSELYKNEKK